MTVDSMVQGVECLLCQVRWWRVPRVLDGVWELPAPQNACLLSRRPPPPLTLPPTPAPPPAAHPSTCRARPPWGVEFFPGCIGTSSRKAESIAGGLLPVCQPGPSACTLRSVGRTLQTRPGGGAVGIVGRGSLVRWGG